MTLPSRKKISRKRKKLEEITRSVCVRGLDATTEKYGGNAVGRWKTWVISGGLRK